MSSYIQGHDLLNFVSSRLYLAWYMLNILNVLFFFFEKNYQKLNLNIFSPKLGRVERDTGILRIPL